LVYKARLNFEPEPGHFVGKTKMTRKEELLYAQKRHLTKVDLVVYYSQTLKEPTKEKNDRKYDAPQNSVPIVCRGGNDRFPCEYVYFGFYSV
jgi:hypothetical protein